MLSRCLLAAKYLPDDRDEILATGTPSRGAFKRRFVVAAAKSVLAQNDTGLKSYDFLSKT